MYSLLGSPLEKTPCGISFDFEALKEHIGLFFRKLDDFTSKSFARNFGGHPRSDIALLNEQSDLNGVNSILARLHERGSDGFGVDVSDSEIRLMFKSKYAQTASEMIEYYDSLLSERDRRSLEAYEGKEKEKQEAELKAKRDQLVSSLTADEKEYVRKAKRDREIETLID